MLQQDFVTILETHPLFADLSQAAQACQTETWLIGGFVRDVLLSRPSKDIDVVCIGSGIKLAQQFAAITSGQTHLTVFKNFGTAQVKTNDWEVEFVGARKESYRSDSRKPIVEDGTREDDQKRRDLTINALAVGLNKDNFGQLLDPFNGLHDLQKKIIRTPLNPNITFSDDPLRMMRAIRFASQLGFDIEPDTFQAIIDNKERLRIVSQERITDELNKIILSPQPSYGFNLLFTSGLLHLFFPEMVALHGVEKINGQTHKDNFYHTLKVLDNTAKVSDDLWLRWAAILHDIAKPPTKRFHVKRGFTFHGHEDKGARMVPGIFRRLKLPMNEKMKYVQKLVKLHLRPIALVKKEVTDSAVRRLLSEAENDTEDLMKLCRADITSKDHNRVQRYLRNFDLVEQKMGEVEEKDSIRNFQPAITGEMIMEIFNLKPSKIIGEIKTEIKEAILEGQIDNSVEQGMPLLLEIGRKRGLTKQ